MSAGGRGGAGNGHKLVLFDIDGTLIWTGGAGSRAMTRAFREWCGIDDCLAGIPVPGRTDTIILSDVLARHGLAADAESVAVLFATYFRCLSEELSGLAPGFGPLPGVVALLNALAMEPSITVALLTGNHSRGARLKLERFGLHTYFVLGAFGEDAADRNDLVPVALDRAREFGLPQVAPRDVVVVGDTPLDVACGHAHGSRTVAVATGGFPVEELRRAGADLAVETLEDTGRLVEWIQVA
jgi:phosphoglycolate phosphatase-like HAD superfamily hydrolase